MEPIILTVLLIIAGTTFWIHGLIRRIDRRLQVVEGQYLALVADLEDRLYSKE